MRSRSMVMGLAISLLLSPAQASAQDLFIDPMFDVSITHGITYRIAEIQSPPGDFRLLLDLYEPIGEDAPPLRPGLILIHGGGFTGGSRTNPALVEICTEMASRGYSAVSIDYRLAGQDPVVSDEFMPFYEALEDSGATLPAAIAAAVEDATHAHRWMAAHAGELAVDPDRIAIGGSSAGGVTSLLEAYSIDDHGITNLPAIGALVDFWGSLGPFVTNMEVGEPPLVIVHGTEDPTVPFADAVALANQAEAVGIPYEFYPVAGAGHGFGHIDIFEIEVEPGVTIFDRIVLFFYAHMSLEELLPPVAVGDTPVESRLSLAVAPNVVHLGSWVWLRPPAGETGTLALYDLAGRRIASHDLAGQTLVSTRDLFGGMSTPAAGVYFMRWHPEGCDAQRSGRIIVVGH